MRVREATLADIPRLAGIRASDPQAGPADARMAAYLAGRHHPRDALGPRVMYLALERRQIAGYVAGHLTTRFDCDGEVQYLYVARDCRRSGVASDLLKALATWFVGRDARRICVDVVPENAAARSFYRKHGAIELNRGWMVWEDMSTSRM